MEPVPSAERGGEEGEWEAMKRVPKFVLEAYGVRDARAWRRKKRIEIRDAIAAVNDARLGCAYLVDGVRLLDLAKRTLNELLEKNKEGR